MDVTSEQTFVFVTLKSSFQVKTSNLPHSRHFKILDSNFQPTVRCACSQSVFDTHVSQVKSFPDKCWKLSCDSTLPNINISPALCGSHNNTSHFSLFIVCLGSSKVLFHNHFLLFVCLSDDTFWFSNCSKMSESVSLCECCLEEVTTRVFYNETLVFILFPVLWYCYLLVVALIDPSSLLLRFYHVYYRFSCLCI